MKLLIIANYYYNHSFTFREGVIPGGINDLTLDNVGTLGYNDVTILHTNVRLASP